jgi:hypothetical protein
LASTEKTNYLAPADQPKSVHELTVRLFPPYTVDGGAVHLAGCRLEDRLFIRMGDSGQARAGALTTDESGQAVDDELVKSLGMDDTVEWDRPPEIAPDRLEETVRQSAECVRRKWGIAGELEARFIWCKYAEGKLRFTIGDRSADLPFSGWTRMLKAPPFVCPYSGVSSYHIAATDDGRIVAAESIRTCAETGRRVLAEELVTCDATGQAVLADQTRICPITQRPVLERVLETCSMCCERISPTVIQGGKCLACRSTQPIAKDAAPLAAFLEQHQNLNRWSKWRISETSEVCILVATGWWKRLVVVIGKNEGDLRRAAIGKRFGAEFSTVELKDLDSPATR